MLGENLETILRGFFSVYVNIHWGGVKKIEPDYSQEETQWMQTEIQKIPLKYKKNLFYCEGG